jgi:predicted molibdopterin-dependent oxidoreductase YjgC
MTGVAAEDIRAAAKALVGAKQSAILLAYGLPYTAQSKEIAIAAANLAILSGNVDKDQSGLFLCGEKSNSQGAIDLGILPTKDGLGAQQMLEAAGQGNLSALYVVGEDPMTSYPDRSKIEKAFSGADFVVVQDLFLSPTAELADVVLPAASFAEKNGTFTNAERRIQMVRAGVTSPGEAKTDYEILTLLAACLGDTVVYTGPEAVFSALAEDAGYTGIAYDQIGPQGVVWGGENLTINKKVLVAVEGAKPVEGEFVLLTGSALYHSGTMSTRATGPQAVVGEAYVEFNFDDAKALKIENDTMVTVKGAGVELKLKAKVDKRLPKGVLFAPYHFADARLNSLYKGEAAIPVQVGK